MPDDAYLSFRGTGGGGRFPDGGAGRIGRLCVNVGCWALEAPDGWVVSGALRLVSLGTDPVVCTLGRPGCIEEPADRPALPLKLLVGERTPLMVLIICSRGDAMLGRPSTPPIGISPEVGVFAASFGPRSVGDSPPRRRACVAGDS